MKKNITLVLLWNRFLLIFFLFLCFYAYFFHHIFFLSWVWKRSVGNLWGTEYTLSCLLRINRPNCHGVIKYCINNLSNKLVTYLANLPGISMEILFCNVSISLFLVLILTMLFFFFKLAMCKNIYQTIFEILRKKYMAQASRL